MKAKIKNYILFCTPIIGYLPSCFFGSKVRYNLSVLVERSTRVDYFAIHYCNALNFLILAYCIYDSKNIDRRVAKFIFIITILDFIHLLFFAKQGYGKSKIGIAVLLYLTSEYIIKWIGSKR